MGANESVPYVHTVRYRGRSIVFLLSQRTAPLIFLFFFLSRGFLLYCYSKNLQWLWILKSTSVRSNQDQNLMFFGVKYETYRKWALLKIQILLVFFPFWPLSLIQHTFRRDVKCQSHTVIIQIFSNNSPKRDKGKSDNQEQ